MHKPFTDDDAAAPRTWQEIERNPAGVGYGVDDAAASRTEGLVDRTKSDRDVAITTIEENRQLRLALETYGRHLDWCGEWSDGDQPCECGFVAPRAEGLPDRETLTA